MVKHRVAAAAPLTLILLSACATVTPDPAPRADGRFLYVASPGIRDYLQYGGHGILVFDVGDRHRFVRRIPFGGLDANGKPLNVKGICASAATQRLYVSTLEHLICIDLLTDEQLWERTYDGG
jgi:hypothetical protein